jgi:hypothetical protein
MPDPAKTYKIKKFFDLSIFGAIFFPVLWNRNYFFRIRIPFSAEFWIRGYPKKIVTDPDPTSKKFRIQFRIRP